MFWYEMGESLNSYDFPIFSQRLAACAALAARRAFRHAFLAAFALSVRFMARAMRALLPFHPHPKRCLPCLLFWTNNEAWRRRRLPGPHRRVSNREKNGNVANNLQTVNFFCGYCRSLWWWGSTFFFECWNCNPNTRKTVTKHTWAETWFMMKPPMLHPFTSWGVFEWSLHVIVLRWIVSYRERERSQIFFKKSSVWPGECEKIFIIQNSKYYISTL